jgi:hypothetical protein
MFVSDVSSSATTMDKVCDIAGCDVAAKPGDVPYVFIVCNKQGTRYEFQVRIFFVNLCSCSSMLQVSTSFLIYHTTVIRQRAKTRWLIGLLQCAVVL